MDKYFIREELETIKDQVSLLRLRDIEDDSLADVNHIAILVEKILYREKL